MSSCWEVKATIRCSGDAGPTLLRATVATTCFWAALMIDTLSGDEGNDTLLGEDDDDTLDGGAAHRLSGAVKRGADSVSRGSDHDILICVTDDIYIDADPETTPDEGSSLDALATLGGHDFDWIQGLWSGPGNSGELTMSGNQLLGDTDGVAGADLVINLTGVSTLEVIAFPLGTDVLV